MDPEQKAKYQRHAAEKLREAGMEITEKEAAEVEIATFGLDDFEQTGLMLVVYENNDRYCAKELVMLPGQTCPEHRHPPVGDDPGKRETFRCRVGEVFLYVEGEPTLILGATPPTNRESTYTVFREVYLRPGSQFTIEPNTLHWFQAGPEGAVVSEFSSTSRDEFDVFTDPEIRRLPVES